MIENRYVQPGQIVVARAPTALKAVVGPGVVICLWDTKRQWGAMAHCVYPEPNGKTVATTRYASVAIPLLVQRMMDEGAQREDLVAKVFGGARPSRWRFWRRSDLGRHTIAVVLSCLRREQIPIIAEDLGGRRGRRLVFLTEENRVRVMRTHDIRKSDWYPGTSDRRT